MHQYRKSVLSTFKQSFRVTLLRQERAKELRKEQAEVDFKQTMRDKQIARNEKERWNQQMNLDRLIVRFGHHQRLVAFFCPRLDIIIGRVAKHFLVREPVYG